MYWEDSFMGRAAQPWHRLPRAMMEYSCLEGFNKCADLALGYMS